MQGHFVHAGEVQYQVPDEGDEPEDHVRQVDPDCVLHSDLTTLSRSGMEVDEKLSKNAEYYCPEDTARTSVAVQEEEWGERLTA